MVRTSFSIAIAGALLLGLAGAAPEAEAQMTCSARKTVLDKLSERYQEEPVAAGITSNGGIVEVLVAPDGLTWTIIVSTPDGTSCLLASGEGWRGKAPHAAFELEV